MKVRLEGNQQVRIIKWHVMNPAIETSPRWVPGEFLRKKGYGTIHRGMSRFDLWIAAKCCMQGTTEVQAEKTSEVRDVGWNRVAFDEARRSSRVLHDEIKAPEAAVAELAYDLPRVLLDERVLARPDNTTGAGWHWMFLQSLNGDPSEPLPIERDEIVDEVITYNVALNAWGS